MKLTLNLKSVFILLTLCYTSGSKSINPSYGHGRIINKSSNNLVAEIIQQENEILDEKEEIEAGEGLLELGVNDKKKKSTRVNLPAYLKLIDENLSIEDSRNEQEGPIARAWLPVEIKREETLDMKRTTSILFQQTQSREILGNFIKAEMILTLKPDAEFNDRNTGTFVQILIDGVEAGESKTLSKKTTFYAFNITELLQRALAKTLLEHTKRIGITFQVYSQHNKNNVKSSSFLDEIFDVQVERPFIMFLYRELLENTVNISSDESQKSLRRKKRYAAGTGPSVQHVRGSNSTRQYFKGSNSTRQASSIGHQGQGSNSTRQASSIGHQGQWSNSTRQASSIEYHGQGSNSTRYASVTTNSVNGTETEAVTVTPAPVPLITPSPSLCRRVEWTVDTEDIDWFGIVSHKKLDLGYCAGTCPFPLQNDHFNFTLHSFFVDRFRRLKVFDVPRNFPHSCCVPISYKPVRVWEEEEENSFVHVEYQDVTVDSCGCR